jgi:desulfoferrodoxin (superoxide reductase-like protein)
MKKLLLIFCLLFVSILVFAHPPKEVALSYDTASKMLTITVNHQIKQSLVSDPSRHYIKEISILVNNKNVVIADYSSQQSDDGEKIIIQLKANSGDKITVGAACSIAGNKTSELTVK